MKNQNASTAKKLLKALGVEKDVQGNFLKNMKGLSEEEQARIVQFLIDEVEDYSAFNKGLLARMNKLENTKKEYIDGFAGGRTLQEIEKQIAIS